MPVTERLARWSGSRPWTVIVVWVFAVIAVTVAAGQVGTRNLSLVETSTGESRAATRLLLDAGPVPAAGEAVVIASDTVPAASPPVADLARTVTERIAGVPGVADVRWDAPELIAQDGRARLVTFTLGAAGDTSVDQVDQIVRPVLDVVEQARADAPPGVTVQEFGDASMSVGVGDLVGEDLALSESIVSPVSLLILFVTFAALVAAGLPLLIGGVSILTAIGLSVVISHLVPMDPTAGNFISMVGMALGIDYTLFVLRREREERRDGHPGPEAIVRAARWSGTAVLVSGTTVVVALSGLMVSGTGIFLSLGIAGMLTVATVLATTLVVLPAVMVLLGDRIERGRLPRVLHRRRRRAAPSGHAGQSRVWAGWRGPPPLRSGGGYRLGFR